MTKGDFTFQDPLIYGEVATLVFDLLILALTAFRLCRESAYVSGFYLRISILVGFTLLAMIDADRMLPDVSVFDLLTPWERTGLFRAVIFVGLLVDLYREETKR